MRIYNVKIFDTSLVRRCESYFYWNESVYHKGHRNWESYSVRKQRMVILMRRPFILLLSITFLFLTTTNVYSQNKLTREKLLEETLMVRYLPTILKVTDKLFICEKITDIKRLGESERQHEVTIEVVTFEQAHEPPYDLFRITLTDIPEKLDVPNINVTHVERKKNLSEQQLNKHCGFKLH
ncbi:hypothetical protein CN586_29055 [Bacillus toyonensis]|uniref:DUF3888 domain-containing protein n=1 Tax=Bacillus toyonensis TaxID=155322 RepID=UPI000BF067AB|nr:DUF3888 domain-containing protein [Bacillus toyonensis]PEK39205.1 hypothetical protein CN586_29055 [Bacillus toyonensis]